MRNTFQTNPDFVWKFALAMTIVAGFSSTSGAETEAEKREQVGVTLGKPDYRDEIRTADNLPLADELGRLFIAPVLEKYREEHKSELKPTEAEIDIATSHFDEQHRQRIKEEEPRLRAKLKAVQKQLEQQDLEEQKRQDLEIDESVLQTQLKPPGRHFAEFVLRNWKFQKHLYDRFGGGRVLWQQAGMEAFDAMHQWLLSREKAGDFKVTDPALRKTLYAYWATKDHGSFLMDDKERIRLEFLEPEWAKKLSDTTKN